MTGPNHLTLTFRAARLTVAGKVLPAVITFGEEVSPCSIARASFTLPP